jgi:hypothetical protein
LRHFLPLFVENPFHILRKKNHIRFSAVLSISLCLPRKNIFEILWYAFFSKKTDQKRQAMHFYGIMASVMIALLLTLIFSTSFRHRGPWGGLLFFFIVIFLASWASQFWINPFGPLLLGVAWVPLVFVAVLIAVLLLAMGASAIDDAPVNPPKEKTTYGANSLRSIGLFFWILVLILIAAIVIGYWVTPIHQPLEDHITNILMP